MKYILEKTILDEINHRKQLSLKVEYILYDASMIGQNIFDKWTKRNNLIDKFNSIDIVNKNSVKQ